MTDRTEEKVRKYIQEYHMIEAGDRIIVGISGGADSVALFYLLEKLKDQIPFSFRVVHINHNLRGKEALRDEQFVENLCRERRAEYACYSFDVSKIAAHRKISTEEAGRMVRMEAFRQEMENWQGNKLALAHHQNDLAETMIHHLCRGTGLKGLCGIHPCKDGKIRPLLCLEREEIEHYLERHRADYVTDSTNLEDDYTRNRIRHQILPVLKEDVNRKTITHMAQTARHLRKVEEFLERQGREVLERWMELPADAGGNGRAWVHEGFFDEEEILKEQALLILLEEVWGGRRDVTAGHIVQILNLKEKEVGKEVLLPGGALFQRQYDGFLLRKAGEAMEERKELVWELSFQKPLVLSHGRITARFLPYFGQEIPEKTYTKWLNYDKINSTLQIRTRRPGDYLVINGEGGRKKLKDYFIDCKIPRQQRDEILLLAAGQEILWIVGYRINEAYRVEKNTKMILEIQYEGGMADGRENQCTDQ